MEKRKEISPDRKRNVFLLISIVILIGIYFLYNLQLTDNIDYIKDKIKGINIGEYMAEDSPQTNSTSEGIVLSNIGLSMLMISVLLFVLSIIIFIVPLFRGSGVLLIEDEDSEEYDYDEEGDEGGEYDYA